MIKGCGSIPRAIVPCVQELAPISICTPDQWCGVARNCFIVATHFGYLSGNYAVKWIVETPGTGIPVMLRDESDLGRDATWSVMNWTGLNKTALVSAVGSTS
jgi:hypothetical protein